MKEKSIICFIRTVACKAAGKTEKQKYHPRETFVSSQKKVSSLRFGVRNLTEAGPPKK
jgi:hypothetical protein